MSYTYDPFVAVDPTNTANVAAKSSGQLYDPTDTTLSTPLAVTDLNDNPVTGNLITTNDLGIAPAFRLAVAEAVWSGGGVSVPVYSFKGVLDQATAASASAQDAVTNASAAQTAAQSAASSATASAASAAGAAGGVAIIADPSNPGLYFVTPGGKLSADTANPGLYLIGA